MIKTLVLYSDIDDLIVIYFVAGVTVSIALHWFLKELKSRKYNSTVKPLLINEESDVSNYTFNFNAEAISAKKTSLLAKITLFKVSMIVVIMPFYEFVETLRPEEYIIPMTCFPGLYH